MEVGRAFRSLFVPASVALVLGACATALPPLPSDGDWAKINATTEKALENARTGESLAWDNPTTGARGTVIPLETDDRDPERPCRRFQQTFTAENTTQMAVGLACRRPDGSWETVERSRFAEADRYGARHRDPYYYDPYYYDPFYDPYFHPFHHRSRYHGRHRVRHGLFFHYRGRF